MDITRYDYSQLGEEQKKAHAALIGKNVASIEQEEYRFKIVFTDESKLEFAGNYYDGPLLVEFEDGGTRPT